VVSPPRLAILTDYPEEDWPSMDLCGEMLLAHLPRDGPQGVAAARVCPPFRRLAQRLPGLGRRKAMFNADRLLNRFVHFPHHARQHAGGFELFHVSDHTYAQLVHALPPGRAGVFCHDLDAFRCLLDQKSAGTPRPGWFRALSRRMLNGMQKAQVVFHSTAAVGRELIRFGLVPADRLVRAPYGIAPEFSPEPDPAQPLLSLKLGWLVEIERTGGPWLAHVGTCIPRKRIDVLLDVVAAVRQNVPELRLLKVGGAWTTEQRAQIARLGLDGAIVHAGGLSRAELAAVYRRAAVVLVPSASEGFGLPVIEALACGAAVVASDIPALREAGGPAAVYAPVGDVAAWSAAVTVLLADSSAAPPRAARQAWAAQFSWATHAATIAAAYHRLLEG
jgi:glycosyltransferase involved in cell wall biosynthesis